VRFVETPIPGLLCIELVAHGDPRGQFAEIFRADRYAEAGIVGPFVQDNLSRSQRNVLRGLHYQEPQAQGKIIQVLAGAIFDVIVDIRRGSPAFGRWFGTVLEADSWRQLWVPPGLAHGFVVLSDGADVLYKCTAFYNRPTERGILFSDPDLAIAWPVAEPLVSDKDRAAPRLRDATVLPVYEPSR
jgi:dTDP-4-dehydrorhamnose 3,5-epimerase